jgi:hypothetical protein
MTTKDIRTSHAHTVCDVCGRTLLRGERAEIYINGGARHSVCELCRPRALHEGWVREGTLPDYNQSGSGPERRRSLLNRLRNRRQGRRSRPSLDDELAGYDAPPPSRFERPRFDGAPGNGRAGAGEEAWNAPEDDWDAADGQWADGPAPYRAHAPDDHPSEPDDHGPEPYGPDEYEPRPYEPRPYEPEPYEREPYEPEPYEREPYEPEPYEPDSYGPPTGADRPDEPPRTRRPWSRPPRSLRSEPPVSQRSARGARPGGRSSRSTRRARPGDQSGESLGRRAEPREPRHVRAVPASQEQKMVAAVELFNHSEHRRTVAGVARSLGGAGVAVLPAAEPPSLVHIVVWWELCWYRYTVDLSDEVPGVRVDGRGYELAELSEAEQTANAAADESGQLLLH